MKIQNTDILYSLKSDEIPEILLLRERHENSEKNEVEAEKKEVRDEITIQDLSEECLIVRSFNSFEEFSKSTIYPRIQILLLDLDNSKNLFGRETISFIKSIKEDARLKDLPIVVLTACNDEEYRLSLLQAGAHDYLLKPVKLEEIKVRIFSILSFKRNIADLKKEIEEQNCQLTILRKDLESFTSTISHDLRSPLAVIRGMCQIILEDYNKNLNELVKKFLEQIDNNADKMQHLIEGIVCLSRVIQRELRKSDIELSTWVKRYLSELQSKENKRQLEFAIDDDIHAVGDIYLIEIAMKNLLDNAWKFTSKKQITKIGFSTKIINGKKTYYVQDNGVGFNIKYANAIFDPLKRAHSENEFPGIGMGLTIVKRIIERHGGKVWAESDGEKETKLWFTLS